MGDCKGIVCCGYVVVLIDEALMWWHWISPGDCTSAMARKFRCSG
jgi:hypothetical protein